MMSTPKLSRRAFNELMAFILANGVTLGPMALSLLDEALPQTRPQPNSEAASGETDGKDDPTTASSSDPGTSNLLAMISQYAEAATASVSRSISNYAKHAITLSGYGYAEYQAFVAEGQVAKGVALSYDFQTTDLASEEFRTLPVNGAIAQTGGSLLTSGLGLGAGFGFSLNLGDVDVFNGLAMNAAKPVEGGSLSVSWNEDSIGISLNVGISFGPQSLSLSQTDTTPLGEIKYENLGRDLENMQNNLFEYSGDYLNR